MKNIEENISDQISAMFRCLDEREDPLFSPSAFWKELCAKHVDLIKRHGFRRFKRTINFEYGQWGVCSFRRPMMTHVLKQLLVAGELPYVALLSRIREARDVEWPVKSRSAATAYKYFVGLLWQLAVSQDRLGCLKSCNEPSIGGPIQVTYKGCLISQDLAQSSLELNRIIGHLQGYNIRTVAEVGAGYGRFAYVLMNMFPDVHFCIFDIPPALAVCQNYLAGALGAEKVRFCDTNSAIGSATDAGSSGRVSAYLPYALQDFPDGYFDLFVNVSSFDEMLPEQVNSYFDLIERKCSGWLYVKGYGTREESDPRRPWGTHQFPFRAKWRKVYEGTDPVTPQFVERIFDLRKG